MLKDNDVQIQPLTSKRIKDIRGKKVGRLTVLSYVRSNRKETIWLCKCECGNTFEARGADINSEHTKSCGCLRLDAFRKTITKHSLYDAPEYSIWQGIKDRCSNPNSHAYLRYGGRGITVCDRWQTSFSSFLSDMGPRPTMNHGIDRIDNDGPYAPDNCRWATNKQQCNNLRKNIFITHDGETHTLSEWADILHVKYSSFASRYYRATQVEKIFSNLDSIRKP
jgi:hypothetical protein